MSLKHDLQLAPRSSPCGRRSCGTGPQLSDLVGHSPKRMSDWKSTQTVIVTGDIGKKMVRSTVTMLTPEKFQVDCVHPSDLGFLTGHPFDSLCLETPKDYKGQFGVLCLGWLWKKNTGKLEGQLVEHSWWLRREEIHEKKQEPGSLECISYSRRLASSWACAICWVCWEKNCDNGNWCIWMYLGATGATGATTIPAMPCGIPRGWSSHPMQGLEFQRRISLWPLGAS